jgi:hypothetical protein
MGKGGLKAARPFSRLAPCLPALLGSLPTGGLRRMASDEATKEIRAHETSYHRFTFMMKWGTLLALLTGFVVILIIAK